MDQKMSKFNAIANLRDTVTDLVFDYFQLVHLTVVRSNRKDAFECARVGVGAQHFVATTPLSADHSPSMRAGVHPCGSQPLREKRLPPRKVHLLAVRRSKVAFMPTVRMSVARAICAHGKRNGTCARWKLSSACDFDILFVLLGNI